MANEDLYGLTFACVMSNCGRPIPPERLKHKAVTCSKECMDLRTRIMRQKIDNKKCRFCHKPSTPNRRRAFSRFSQWEAKNPELAYPAEWKVLEEAGIKLATFAAAVRQAASRDIAIDITNPVTDLQSTKSPDDTKPTPELDEVLETLKKWSQDEARAVSAGVGLERSTGTTLQNTHEISNVQSANPV